MFKEMRRNDRQLSEEEALTLLEKCGYGIISTSGPDGYPYGIPLDYVFQEKKIYFHCALTGQMLDNIAYNSKVAFCVVGEVEVLPAAFSTKYESTIVFGTVEEVANDDKRKIMAAFLSKYSPAHIEAGEQYIDKAIDKARVFCINPEHITAKAKR